MFARAVHGCATFQQLYRLWGHYHSLVDCLGAPSSIHSSPEEVSVLMYQGAQMCSLLLHAHGLHPTPTHTHTEWGSRFDPLEWGVISYAFTLYLHSSAQAPSVCAASPSLFVKCVCMWQKERERGESSSCIYTCMSRSLLAVWQRNTPAA